jgi:hypothetical protein
MRLHGSELTDDDVPQPSHRAGRILPTVRTLRCRKIVKDGNSDNSHKERPVPGPKKHE